MRISDWSSDVCSSDLAAGGGAAALVEGAASLAGQKRDDFLREQVRQGGILLWVKLHEIDEVDEARAILTRNGASEIHVHPVARSEEHTSELQSLMRISYAVFCLKKKKTTTQHNNEQLLTKKT